MLTITHTCVRPYYKMLTGNRESPVISRLHDKFLKFLMFSPNTTQLGEKVEVFSLRLFEPNKAYVVSTLVKCF